MSDALVGSTTPQIMDFPVWDWQTDPTGTFVPVIDGAEADSQEASLYAYVDKNSIPQLPGIGVPWSEFLTGQNDFAGIDCAIRYNLSLAGLSFQPSYDMINGQLVASVVPH